MEVTEKKVRRERMGHTFAGGFRWCISGISARCLEDRYLLGIPSKKLRSDHLRALRRDQRRRRFRRQGIERLATLSGEEYLDVLAALPKGNQSLDDSDPNKPVALMGAEAIYTLLEAGGPRLDVLLAASQNFDRDFAAA